MWLSAPLCPPLLLKMFAPTSPHAVRAQRTGESDEWEVRLSAEEVAWILLPSAGRGDAPSANPVSSPVHERLFRPQRADELRERATSSEREAAALTVELAQARHTVELQASEVTRLKHQLAVRLH